MQTGLSSLAHTENWRVPACSLEVLAGNTWKAPQGSLMRGVEKDGCVLKAPFSLFQLFSDCGDF